MSNRPSGRRTVEPDVLIESIRIENIRGFDNTLIRLGGSDAVLVGPNNAGKTSVLRILDWILNSADASLMRGDRGLRVEERELLIPARHTGGKARRITLTLRFRDGRAARKFAGSGREVRLRVGVRPGGVTVQFGDPKRGETASTKLGIELLSRVQAAYSAEYVPPHRSATADGFQTLVSRDLMERAKSALLQSQAGGRPTVEQKKLQQAVDDASEVTVNHLKSFWDEIVQWIPESLTTSGDFEISLERADLLEYLVARAAERVATGSHDAEGVRIHELGAGHQSLLWLALKLKEQPDSMKHRLLLVEEPESFLHPSAQRQVARQLFDAKGRQVVMSTHSTVLVDEADAHHLKLLRGHRVFSLDRSDERRMHINSSLLTGRGSEVIFASAILLVEGQGDRLYFERLRRRLEGVLPSHLLGTMAVIEVGGKTQFGPWVRLLEGFLNKTTGERPISWIVASDSADAISDTLRGLNDAGISVPSELRAAALKIPQDSGNGHVKDVAEVVNRTLATNAVAASTSFGLQFVPIDLEYAALSSVKPATSKVLAAEFGVAAKNAVELMAALGSKGAGKKPGDKKAPWMRERAAAVVSWNEISIGVKDILWQWACLASSQMSTELPARPRELLESVSEAGSPISYSEASAGGSVGAAASPR